MAASSGARRRGDGAPEILSTAVCRRRPMPVIGQFTREDDGFIGHLTTLSLPQDIIIVAAEPSDAENAPDFRVHVLDTVSNETGAEIDAGWKRTGEKAGDYVSLQLDDPPSNIRSVQTSSS
jgi:uncharacterized protein (DUF736 family)